MEDLTNSIEYVQRLRVQLRNAVLYTGDSERIARVKSDVLERENSLLEYMNDYGDTITNSEARRLFNDTMNMLRNEFIPGLNAIIASAENGTEQSQLIHMMNELSPVTDRVRDNTLELMEIKMEEAHSANHAATDLYNGLLLLIIITLALAVIISIVLVLHISGLISKPLHMLTVFMTKAGNTGDITLRQEDREIIAEYSQIRDEIGQTINSCASFVGHVTKISETLGVVSNGDLTVDLRPISDEDTMGNSLKKMLDSLNSMFKEINVSTVQVTEASRQIAGSSQALASGSTEQASVVEELSASVLDISDKTKQNAEQASKASKLANSIKNKAETGNRQMGEMMSAVNEINQASQNISRVIKVIDDIAFQTNILALNAAVEAARAGQHGKGFAVVAEEVRNLAAKSAEAAKDTGGLISNSIEKAELGAKIANDTAASLAEIVAGINESSHIVEEIAHSSEEQSMAISQINMGLEQVTTVIQQNSATAEESAAASEEMSGQSHALEDLVSQFKLRH
jgi:methyl-accepting chemotaxis protein